MTVAYIGLGANLGDARQAIKDAIVCLAQQIGVTIIGKSDLYRTAPIESSGDDYLNCAVAVETSLSARQLLTLCLKIELHFGRERPYKNAPRTLDLDLLVYGDERIAEPDLIVPHPRLALRAFVLHPLADIAPELDIPGVGRVSALLPHVADQRIERVAQGCCPTKRVCTS
ncbi:2-amino-4-hydroxy-6-hydroxymethyldihydropteridine diphosphokinase [Pandoraea oxalativorans]|uniref:2-amino-4-hydroxy-6-hydroxymethyldihydropteridine pyrophosphokinase n=1 Tax=Pandoraea oxalativorans TaxID=573737 RepID=A0A0E3U963_9BURK|nr:2-amino-4-hydroxy-6-hydroxymethyldihydropteridine diphosphokinase [Pandoraea oxalativorans]AKC71918.1 2-amino-4-hydroxy-6-hydroxymethyldihydropteridine diphosphokinase [Pandoraea oxalativorans]